MKIKDSTYRTVAKKLVVVLDDRHPPWAGAKRSLSRTRVPAGSWVQVYVWVPRTMALLEETNGT